MASCVSLCALLVTCGGFVSVKLQTLKQKFTANDAGVVTWQEME